MMDWRADEYFNDDDYLPPGSPALVPFRPNIRPDGSFRDHSADSDISSDSEEELDIHSPWAFSLQDDTETRARKRSLPYALARRRDINTTKADLLLLQTLASEGYVQDLVKSRRLLTDQPAQQQTENTGPVKKIKPNETASDKSKYEQSAAPLAKPLRPPRTRKRLTLPIIVHTNSGPVNVVACPDSGSEDNIMSLELAMRLGLTVQAVESNTRLFSLANGKVVSAVGQTSFKYTFHAKKDPELESECFAYIFERLVVPIIAGAEFLDKSKVFTQHRELLAEEIVPAMQSLRVNSIGRPKRSLVCRLDTFIGCANADTGSDLDLISPGFAQSRSLNSKPASETLQFADGSIGHTSGVVQTAFAVGAVDPVKGFMQSGKTLNVEFFILESLTSDILVGQETLEVLEIFMQHLQSFVSCPPSLGLSDCNIIRHIGTIETKVSNVVNRVTKAVKEFIGERPTRNQPEEPQSQGHVDPSSSTSSGIQGTRERLVNIQRENARLEQSANMACASPPPPPLLPNSPSPDIQGLPAPSLYSPPSYPPSPYVQDPDTSSGSSRAPSVAGSPMSMERDLPGGEYVCTFPGCTAPPFQTRYLLNAHANVHCTTRPHYCPVQGCPRAEGGRGFERKNEMIRHGLVHDSPGYLCPFCPDREHKYPRPDNLARHVRVHHVDKDKDDPLLREVLSQWPDRPNRGWRRRGGPVVS